MTVHQVTRELYQNKWYRNERHISTAFDSGLNMLVIVLLDRFNPNTYNGINETLTRLSDKVQYNNNETLYNIGDLQVLFAIDN